MEKRDDTFDQEMFQMWKTSFTERRKHSRCRPVRGTRALVEGRPYELFDVSVGGLSLCDPGRETIPEETVLTLYSHEEGLHIDSLLCRKVSDARVMSGSYYGRGEVNRIGLELVNVDPAADPLLAPFMSPDD